MKGSIRRIVTEKGFGFIRSEASGVEYFFHRSGFIGDFDALASDVEKGQDVKVEFQDVVNNKGPRAENVKRIEAKGNKNEEKKKS